MNIKEALRNVISALGGTPTGKNVPSLINEVSENVSGGGSGSSPLIVNVIPDETGAGITLDHTWRDIYTALCNGTPVFSLTTVGDISSSSDDSEVSVSMSQINAAMYDNSGSTPVFLISVADSSLVLMAPDPDGYPTSGSTSGGSGGSAGK